ncbi:MAG: ABC transporter substrate-binding protein, partial [Verrucomicrobiota bacterium]
PSLMEPCLQSGSIDGYCVGEPFNSSAVQNGIGVILAESADLSPMHPEKALVVSNAFLENHGETHIEVIRAVDEAAALCETPTGREEAVTILSQSHYLGIDPELIRSSLFAGDSEGNAKMTSESFHVFSHPEVNRPTADKANWLVTHMRNAGLLASVDTRSGPPLSNIFREDLFEEATSRLAVAS